MTSWIEEAKEYVGFSSDDEARLRRFDAVARPRYREVIDHFYRVIAGFEGARKVLTGGAAQVKRLEGTLFAWLETGLGGPHDAAWYDARARIGRRHVAVGLAVRYMFTAMNLIRGDLHRIARETGVEPGTIESIDRWLDLELAIMVQTYQEHSEQRLLDRERDAQHEQMAAMQRMSAGLAHEVRNPLNSAQLQLQLLTRRLRKAGVEASLLEATSLVDGEIHRLSGLLEEFLDFARPVRLAPTATDVVGVARQVVELATAAATRRGVTVTLSGATALVISCDPGKLHQIVQNLVANAVDAATRRVEVEVREAPGGVAIRVHDDGPGIPETVLPRIYEPFFSTKEGGTGMGLAITYSLVALHGGTIVACNRGGAEFVVTLPSGPAREVL
jgi:signal transduction histidine kinase